MTEIAFYTNVTDPVHLIQKLVQKAHKLYRRLHISVRDEDHLRAVAEGLYKASPTSFLGISATDSQEIHDLTSAIITYSSNCVHSDIIVNLTPQVPDNFSSFKRLIEIVCQNEENISTARNRYRWYKDRGYSIATYKL